MSTPASSRGFATPRFDFRLQFVEFSRLKYRKVLEVREKKRRKVLLWKGEGNDRVRVRVGEVSCCCSDPTMPTRRNSGGGGGCRSGKSGEKIEDWRFDFKKMPPSVRVRATPAMSFPSPQSRFVSKQDKFYPRCTPRSSGPQSRDTPPKRDTGIANEKDWGINLLNENVSESGTNEDGSTWYRESGEDLGENGYRCRWTRMGGLSHDGSSEWKEMVDAVNLVY